MGKGRTQENYRLGLKLETAIRIGSREWIHPKSKAAWGTWMRRLGLQDITAADLDQLCQYFVLREGVRQLAKEQGLGTAAGLNAYSKAQMRMLQILRGLRLTRQAVDHDVIRKAQPNLGGPDPHGGPPELGVVRREGMPHVG